MQLSNTPTKMVLPFAATGGKRAIPTASQVGITPGAASLADGFPPLTRTALSAGGVPPSGVDMNGVLFEISDVIRWANVGGGYAYDGTFAADSNVGGYPKGARVMRSDGLGYWINTTENNTTDPEATGATAAGWFPDFTSGATAVTMTSSNVTLTSLQYGKPLIVITGALTANLNLIFPAMAFDWTIVNATTGAFSITAKTASGTGTILVPDSQIVVGDGTNIKPSSQFIQLGIGAVSRRFLDKARDFVSVKDFGAVGDGVTNDAAAIQAAVNSLSALTYGGILYFPAGLYLVGATINVPKTANIKVTLYGYGANIARFGSFTGSLFYFGEVTNATSVTPPYILGITFIGPYLTPIVGNLVDLQNSNGTVFRDCVFLSGTHAVGMNNSFAVRFLACKFQYQSEYGIVSTTNTMNLVVSDCQFNSISVGTLGADVFIAVSSSNITIRDSDFEGGSVMLSLPAGGDQIAIKGNYIEGKTTVAPIYFGATTTSVDISNNSIGFNTGTQIWRNVVGGTLTYNVFWDQPQSVDATCVDFDISHNTFKGSSNVIYRKWAAPTLLNSFTNVGGTWAVAGYTKDKTGTVSLKGMITAATDNVGFTLPSGYRPGEDMRFSSLGSTSLAGNIFINGATGAVTIARSANGSIDLSCVRFMAGA